MTEITFTKMHGCGNDFVVLDCMDSQPADMAGIARILCQRRFGVGADQLLTIKPSDSADFRMEIYNADGGEVEMCGNGIRCFAKYVYEHGLTRKREMEVDTLAGIMRPRLKGDDVEVDMGQPVLDGREIPVDADGIVVDHLLAVDGIEYSVTCVSMGNPHCVLFVEDVATLDLSYLGPRFETHSFFPNRVNTEFAQVLGSDEVRMRVWERGAGETWACGTGASAVAVAGVLTGRTGKEMTVHLTGGDLEICWADDERIYMTGPAKEVFQGSIRV